MEPALGLIEGAHPDAVAAVTGVFCPKPEAFFLIDIPLKGPSLGIGDINGLGGSVSMADGLARAIIRTFLADLTELGHPKFNGFIGNQGHVGEDFAQPHP